MRRRPREELGRGVGARGHACCCCSFHPPNPCQAARRPGLGPSPFGAAEAAAGDGLDGRGRGAGCGSADFETGPLVPKPAATAPSSRVAAREAQTRGRGLNGTKMLDSPDTSPLRAPRDRRPCDLLQGDCCRACGGVDVSHGGARVCRRGQPARVRGAAGPPSGGGCPDWLEGAPRSCSGVALWVHAWYVAACPAFARAAPARGCAATATAARGRRLSLSGLRAFFVMLLCTLACAGVGGALDDRMGAMDNDTDRTSTIHMNVGSVHYPPMINSGRSGRQTVDDLVFNHFLIHSLGGGGWWRGHSNAAGAKPADAAAGGTDGGGGVGQEDGIKAGGAQDLLAQDLMAAFSTLRGEDPSCSLHHNTIRAANFDHNVSMTQTCVRKVAWRLWRSRYLLGDEVIKEDDGLVSVRLAKDYQPDAGQLPGALRLIKLLRDKESLTAHWQRLERLWQLFPDLVARPVEALEAADDEVLDPSRPFIIVLDGGQPLSHLIAQQDQGIGMDRALAVQILQDVEQTVKQVVARGYSLHALTPAHIIIQNGRAKLLDAHISHLGHLHHSFQESASPGAQLASPLHQSPLCLPEQSFQVGAGTVWAFKNIVYLMMARPGNTMFACQRVDDDNLHRASVTLQTSRLYLIQIRVRSGPAAWLPDPRIDTVLI